MKCYLVKLSLKSGGEWYGITHDPDQPIEQLTNREGSDWMYQDDSVNDMEKWENVTIIELNVDVDLAIGANVPDEVNVLEG